MSRGYSSGQTGRESGSALITSLVMGVVFSIIGVTILRLATMGSDINSRTIETIRSYWANEGALRLALRALTLDPGENGKPHLFNGTISFGTEFTLNGYTCGGPSSETVINISPVCPTCLSYNISVSTQMHGNSRLKNVNRIDSLSLKSYPRYTFFEDTTAEDDLLWRNFIVDGDFHSNAFIHVAADCSDTAHVLGEATTAERNPVAPSAGELYPSPYDLGIKVTVDDSAKEPWLKRRFPDYAHIGEIETANLSPDEFSAAFIQDGGADVIVPVAIFFQDGTISFYKKSSGGWTQFYPTVAPIMKVKADVYVWGHVTGQYTVVADMGKDIYLGGPITNGPQGVLALVSGNDIIVPKKFKISSIYEYDFSENNTTISACLFMKHGGLRVADIDAYTQVDDPANLHSLTIHGCAMVRRDKEKIWEFENGKYGGLNCFYRRDNRFYYNELAPPGIPFPRALDEELTTTAGGKKFMWILASGKWENNLVR